MSHEDEIARKRAQWTQVMLDRGHTPVLDEDDGDALDIFATSDNCHNGPACSVCGWGCCWHCKPDPGTAVPKTCNN